MVNIPLGEWMPDQAFNDASGVVEAKNVIPSLKGYQPFRNIMPFADALPDEAIGGRAFRKTDGSITTIAGTGTGLYKRASGLGWTDISGTAYTAVDADHFWQFTQFGDLAIGVNGVDAPQKYDFVTPAATASNLGGTPPIGKLITTVRDFVVIGNLVDDENAVHWSGINDAEGWTIGTGLSDIQYMPDGGRVMSLWGGDVGYVFQERGITRMMFAPGSPFIFQFDKVDPDRGSAAYRGLCYTGRQAFFLAHDGFFSFVDGATIPIGIEKVDKWFFDNVQRGSISKTFCGIDTVKKLVLWAWYSGSASVDARVADRALIFHWGLNRWARAEFNVTSFLDTPTRGLGLDELDPYGTMETLPSSLDSSAWRGDPIASILAAFDANFELGYFDGQPMAAKISTADVQFFPPGRSYLRGVAPICDAAGMTVDIGVRERKQDNVTQKGAVPVNSILGVAPQRASSRFHSITVNIPDGADWSHIESIEVDAVPDGQR